MHKYKTMISYCLKCKKENTESINPRVSKTNNSKTMLLSKYVVKHHYAKFIYVFIYLFIYLFSFKKKLFISHFFVLIAISLNAISFE